MELSGCGHGQNRGGSVCRQTVLVADRRRRSLPRRILGRRSEIGQRRGAGRECKDACYAVRRRLVSTVWRPLSGLAVPGPTVRVACVHGPVVRCPVVRCPVVRYPVLGCPSRRVSAASALSASRSAAGSVRPGAGDAGGGLGRLAGPVSAAMWSGVVGLRLWLRSTGRSTRRPGRCEDRPSVATEPVSEAG